MLNSRPRLAATLTAVPLLLPALVPVAARGDDAPLVRESPLAALISRLSPTAVDITGARDNGDGTMTGWSGAGVVVHPDGYVVTNDHVAGNGALTVHLVDGRSLPARVLGRDPGLDVAVLEVDAGGPLAAATIGSSGDLHLGEPAIVIGNPNGLRHTVTTGIVSRLGGPDLQVSAPINGGNSGGPVFNADGELVGVVKAKGGEALGFAIPVDAMLAALPGMLLDPVERGARIGVHIDPLAAIPAVRVAAGGPAARGGLRDGDAISAIDGRPVGSVLECLLRLADRPADAPIAVTAWRGPASVDAEIVPEALADRPAWIGADSGFGAEYRVVTGGFDALPGFDGRPIAARGYAGRIAHDVPGAPADDFALRFDGLIDVPADGAWTFTLTSDDGSRLTVDGEVIVDLDGLHSAVGHSGKVRLQRGLHPFRVDYFERRGDAVLRLEWAGPGTPRAVVPENALRHARGDR